MCQPAHVPVGTIPCTPGRDENLPKPGRDFWGRPTGTITIRQSIPDRDYPRPSKETRPGLFRLVPAHTFHSSHADHPLFPCVTNLIVAPVTLCWTLKFRNWLFFVSFHAYISNPGRVSCVTGRYYFHLFFYPDRGYKPANSEEKHSKCYLKPAKEPIRLQKKIVLCKSYMFFHLHLF